MASPCARSQNVVKEGILHFPKSAINTDPVSELSCLHLPLCSYDDFSACALAKEDAFRERWYISSLLWLSCKKRKEKKNRPVAKATVQFARCSFLFSFCFVFFSGCSEGLKLTAPVRCLKAPGKQAMALKNGLLKQKWDSDPWAGLGSSFTDDTYLEPLPEALPRSDAVWNHAEKASEIPFLAFLAFPLSTGTKWEAIHQGKQRKQRKTKKNPREY